MTYDTFDSSKLVTTSYDGTCRIFDINEKKSSVIYGDPEDDQFTTYHAQVDRDCFLVALGKTGQRHFI
jgi:WD40 repeat protein